MEANKGPSNVPFIDKCRTRMLVRIILIVKGISRQTMAMILKHANSLPESDQKKHVIDHINDAYSKKQTIPFEELEKYHKQMK